MKKLNININDVIKRHESGKSIKQIAKSIGCSRAVIYDNFNHIGYKARNRSESMYERMKQTSPEGRQQLTKKAHDAVRGMIRSEKDRIKRANGVQKSLSKIGKWEKEFFDELEHRGLDCIKQQAVNIYNIDIGIKSIAVEILSRGGFPLNRKNDFKKIKYLCNHGWSVIYIWSSVKKEFNIPVCCDQICVFVDLIQSDPSLIGEYRVIGRTGNLVASGRGDCI